MAGKYYIMLARRGSTFTTLALYREDIIFISLPVVLPDGSHLCGKLILLFHMLLKAGALKSSKVG